MLFFFGLGFRVDFFFDGGGGGGVVGGSVCRFQGGWERSGGGLGRFVSSPKGLMASMKISRCSGRERAMSQA